MCVSHRRVSPDGSASAFADLLQASPYITLTVVDRVGETDSAIGQLMIPIALLVGEDRRVQGITMAWHSLGAPR